MITEEQKNIIIDEMMPFNPVKIGIFGSVARSEDTEKSDIDILYQLKNVIKLTNLLRLHDKLEQKLNKKIDLVSERYLHPKLKPYIMNDLKIIYANQGLHSYGMH
ncbi:MAG: nucleotidyltransferase domain-containing protein [Prevotellaceae bacterium]|jgi:predicted nucleotidyltransferase|nr:nucleotidyltransferase domain-containing protein [Prevotellaceae bacterium]